MSSKRSQFETVFAILVTLVMLVVAAVAFWIMTTRPVHEDAALVPSTAAAAPADRYTRAAEASRALARTLLTRDNVPGLSVAVAVYGTIAWAEGFGWADVDHHTPVTPQTRYRLGALSKPLTATATALLHDRGRLELDAPVQEYIAAYPRKQWPITVRQLMGDVAGVHRIRGDNNDAMPAQQCASLGEAVSLVANEPLLFEPGTQHRYSVWGWILVSAVVEGAAGEPFDRVMARDVFARLGMTRTVVAEAPGLDVATPFYSTTTIVPNPFDDDDPTGRVDYSCLAGAGAFVSTPTDLARFGAAVSKPGLLKAETLAAFQTPGRLASGEPTTYGLGWTIGTVQIAGRPTRMVSHRGSPRGGTAALLLFPDLGVVVAATLNAPFAGRVDPFALLVAEAFIRRLP
jgi:serine beta-lactamase-like protein LACTB, mitochondrial